VRAAVNCQQMPPARWRRHVTNDRYSESEHASDISRRPSAPSPPPVLLSCCLADRTRSRPPTKYSLRPLVNALCMDRRRSGRCRRRRCRVKASLFLTSLRGDARGNAYEANEGEGSTAWSVRGSPSPCDWIDQRVMTQTASADLTAFTRRSTVRY